MPQSLGIIFFQFFLNFIFDFSLCLSPPIRSLQMTFFSTSSWLIFSFFFFCLPTPPPNLGHQWPLTWTRCWTAAFLFCFVFLFFFSGYLLIKRGRQWEGEWEGEGRWLIRVWWVLVLGFLIYTHHQKSAPKARFFSAYFQQEVEFKVGYTSFDNSLRDWM